MGITLAESFTSNQSHKIFLRLFNNQLNFLQLTSIKYKSVNRSDRIVLPVIRLPHPKIPMKTLLLMRHAKSSWNDKKEDDRDRPLSKRGKKNAQDIGELLRHEKMAPELILSSAALRARQTAEYVMDELKYHGDICYLNKLYMGEVEVYLQEVQGLSDEVNTLLLIGHSPVLDTFLQMLTGKIESLPTASVACLKAPIDTWKDLKLESDYELVQIWRAKDL